MTLVTYKKLSIKQLMSKEGICSLMRKSKSLEQSSILHKNEKEVDGLIRQLN